MAGLHYPARLNIKALILIVGITVLLGVCAVGGRKIRRVHLAKQSLVQAETAFANGDWLEARKLYRRYLAVYSDDVDVLQRFAEASLSVRPIESDYIRSAITAYRRILQDAPGHAEITPVLARIYFGIGDYNEAAYISRQRLEVDPDDIDAERWLARSMLGRHRYKEATTMLERIVERDPQDIESSVLLSSAAMQENASTGVPHALKWLDQAVEKSPQSALALAYRARFLRSVVRDLAAARADLDAADGMTPKDPRTLLLLGEEWIYHNEKERAKSLLTSVDAADLRSDRPFDPEGDGQTARWFVANGRLALARGDGVECLELAERALAECPLHTRGAVLPVVVELYLAGGRLEDARSALQNLEDELVSRAKSAASPQNDAIVFLRADVAKADGKYYEAINLLKGLLVHSPRGAEAWKQLSRCYSTIGRADLSSSALAKYVELVPNDVAAQIDLARALRHNDAHQALVHAEQAEQALPGIPEPVLLRIEASMRTSGAKFPGSALAEAVSAELATLRAEHPRLETIRTLQAEVALRENRVGDAMVELRGAIDECHDTLAASMMLANLQRREGLLDEATETCVAAIQRNPDFAGPRITLAEILAAVGKSDEAEQSLVDAIDALSDEERTAARYALIRLLLGQESRDPAIAMLEELRAERPHDARPRLLLLKELDVGDHEGAAQALIDDLRRIEGESGLHWRIEQARLWLRGERWREHSEEITSLLSFCIEKNGEWTTPVTLLGDMYERVGKLREAEATYRQALTSVPESVEVNSRLLRLLKRQRRFGDAKETLESASLPSGLLSGQQVEVELGLGDPEAAMKTLELRIASDPQDASSRAVLASLIYTHRGDVEGAHQLLDEAQELAPDSLDVVIHRVHVLQSEGEADESLALLNDFVSRRNDYTAHRLRGEYFLFSSRPELAEADFLRLPELSSQSVRGWTDLAWFYQITGRPAEAVAAFDRGLEIDAGNLALRLSLMKILVAGPDSTMIQRGRSMLEELSAELPDDPEILMVRASVQASQGTPESARSAISMLNRVIEFDPHRIDAHVQLVGLAQKYGELGKALAFVTRAMGANPDSLELRMLRAGLELDNDHDPAARDLARSVLEVNPKSVQARNLLTMIALRAGELVEARTLNMEATKIDPNNESVMLLGATILDEEGHPDQALAKLEAYRKLRGNRTSVRLLLALAEQHRNAGGFDRAASCIDEALRQEPNSVAVVSANLRNLAAQKRYDEIQAILNEIHMRHPAESTLMSLAGMLLTASGDKAQLERAQTAYERTIELAPSRVDGYLGLARVGHRRGDFVLAEQSYRAALKLEPYHRDALNELAWILGTELERSGEGLEIAERAAARFPDDPFVLDTRGVLLESLNRLNEARRDLERCQQLAEDPAVRTEVLLHLGRVCLAQGDRESAQRWLQEARRIMLQYQVGSEEVQNEIRQLLEQVS